MKMTSRFKVHEVKEGAEGERHSEQSWRHSTRDLPEYSRGDRIYYTWMIAFTLLKMGLLILSGRWILASSTSKIGAVSQPLQGAIGGRAKGRMPPPIWDPPEGNVLAGANSLWMI